MMSKQIMNQKKTQLQIRQTQLAVQFAAGKERFHWYSCFYGLAVIGLPAIAAKSGNHRVLGALVPITFIWAYQYDMFYGDKQYRILKEAARLIKEEPDRFYLPDNNTVISRPDEK